MKINGNGSINTDTETIECERCLLTNKIPGVQIKKDGICSVCHEHDRLWGNWHETKIERLAILDKILENAKKKIGYMMF